MTTVRVIPCLDIKDGRVVKGTNFIGLRDSGDPVELAKFYNDQGADELVFLDITATHESRAPVVDLAKKVAEQVFIPFTVGGGIQSLDDIRGALLAGADKVSLNSAAVKDPALITLAAERFGSQCILVAIDAKRNDDRWHVFTAGGRRETGMDAIEWARTAERNGAGEILLTSMDRDGTRDGYDIDLVKAVTSAVAIPVIASGGAGNARHLIEAANAGADAVLLAGILHDGHTSVTELKKEMAHSGLPIRLLP